MSYTRDRDRGTRGVGAIASRDLSPRRTAVKRFARRPMGDMPSGDCWMMDNAGAYYIRRANGNIEKVPQSLAMQLPQCNPPAGGGIRSAKTALQTAISRAQTLYTSGNTTSLEPGALPTSSATPVATPGGAAPLPSSSATPVTVPVVVAPTPLPPATPGGGRSTGLTPISTQPTKSPSSSVSTTWTPPAPTVMTFPVPTPPPDVTVPVASSSMSTGEKLALVGAGIGLLYLLTRK